MHVGDFPHERVADRCREREVDRLGIEQCGRLADPLADEWRTAVVPRDADRDLAGRLGFEFRGESLEHPRAVGDSAGHRPGVVEGGREREAPVERDEAVAGLEADDPAAGGGDPDRAARVGSERCVREPGGECGGRAAAGAAGRPSGRDRVGNRAEVRVLGGDAVGELVQVRLADVHVAGALEAHDRLGAPLGHVVGEEDRPVGRGQPGGVEEILDREPKPIGLADLVRPREKNRVHGGAPVSDTAECQARSVSSVRQVASPDFGSGSS